MNFKNISYYQQNENKINTLFQYKYVLFRFNDATREFLLFVFICRQC